MPKPWCKSDWLAVSSLVFLPPVGIGIIWFTGWPHNRKFIATGLGLFWWLIVAVNGLSNPQKASAEHLQETGTVDKRILDSAATPAIPKDSVIEIANNGDLYSVTRIHDGDTLEVFKDDETITVRLACIDAPETAQTPYGQISTNRLASLTSSQVRLNVVDQDRYGRSVAEVYTSDGGFINLQMLESGDAVVYTRYLDSCGNNSEALITAERQARFARRGVWESSSFVMPWDYRRGVRATSELEPAPEPVETPTGQDIAFPSCVDGDCNCSDFSTWDQAQAVLEAIPGDPHRLDRDKDGVACEGLR